MNSRKLFKSEIKEVGNFACDLTDEAIKKEAMFFNSSLDFALLNGGSITRSFIRALPDEWKISDCVFD